MERQTHFSLKETFIGSGSSAKLAAVTLCGLVTVEEADLVWSPADVTCPECMTNMPPDFRPAA